MAARPGPPGDAFELLVRASQHANAKLRDVAMALVLVACGELEDADNMTMPPKIAYDTAQRLWEALHV
jgi:hypothetical protein